jgi:predicted transcriptional regulator
MSPVEQMRDEILAVMWRYSQESDATLLDAVKAAHLAAERILHITLNSNDDAN